MTRFIAIYCVGAQNIPRDYGFTNFANLAVSKYKHSHYLPIVRCHYLRILLYFYPRNSSMNFFEKSSHTILRPRTIQIFINIDVNVSSIFINFYQLVVLVRKTYTRQITLYRYLSRCRVIYHDL